MNLIPEFGPVAPLSGSYSFDTLASPQATFGVLSDGVSYVNHFVVRGGVSDLHTQLGSVWSLDVPASSGVVAGVYAGSSAPGGYWLDWGMGNGLNPTSMFIHSTATPAITQQQWVNSPDPVADFFRRNSAFRIDWTVTSITDPNYPRGSVSGLGYAHEPHSRT